MGGKFLNFLLLFPTTQTGNVNEMRHFITISNNALEGSWMNHAYCFWQPALVRYVLMITLDLEYMSQYAH